MSLTALQGMENRLRVDTSEGSPVYLLLGANGSYLRLSPNTFALLRAVTGGSSFAQIAENLAKRRGVHVSPIEVEVAYRSVTDRIAAIEERAGQSKGGFWFRVRLIPGGVVARVAARCSFLFHPIVAATLAVPLLIALMIAAKGAPRASADHFWPSYGMFLVSVLLHEIGHASACSRYGAKPSDIGLAAYFIYPSFYSDVSAAWQLSRWQRVIVDLGGVYFQLLFGAACAFAYAVTSWEPLLGTTLLIAGSCLFSLNPILKFDGYWVIADALGVTNLGQQGARIARHLADRIRGRDVASLPWPRAITACIGVYAAVSFAFWAWFVLHLVPMLVTYATHYADVARAFGSGLITGKPYPDWTSLKEFVTATFLLLLPAVMAWRLVRSVVRAIRSRLRKRVTSM